VGEDDGGGAPSRIGCGSSRPALQDSWWLPTSLADCDPTRVGFLETDQEADMAFARVVTFDGVSKERIEEVKREMEDGGRPDEVPAKEILVLHDPEAESSLVILFFESEDDYRRGDEALNAMPAGDTPGQRTSVKKYEVASRMTA